MQCVKPFRIKNPDRFVYKKPGQSVGPEWLEVPCGHCVACRIARSREWAIRILHETEFWESSCFVTLTYRDEDLPSNGSLERDALTKFFKRLRKDLGDRKIKYYACGEYGDTYGRPHYHAIIFGLNALKDKKLIESNWPYGWVKVGGVSYDSARYVAGYVQKKLYGKESKQYEDRGILPPFSRISKGVGERYVDKYWNKEIMDSHIDTIKNRSDKRLKPSYNISTYFKSIAWNTFKNKSWNKLAHIACKSLHMRKVKYTSANPVSSYTRKNRHQLTSLTSYSFLKSL